jgi:hypothetical protein
MMASTVSEHDADSVGAVGEGFCVCLGELDRHGPAGSCTSAVQHADPLKRINGRRARECGTLGTHNTETAIDTRRVLTKTTVIHNMRDDFDVYIGRAVPERGIGASKWGNPFVMIDDSDIERERVISAYREWISTQSELLSSLEELRGQRLGCWCAPKRCHGDVLVELLG